jgi:hypothetical protein
MPRVGFEPTIPVLEGANTFHALDRAATVIGRDNFTFYYFDYFPSSSLNYFKHNVSETGSVSVTRWQELSPPTVTRERRSNDPHQLFLKGPAE